MIPGNKTPDNSTLYMIKKDEYCWTHSAWDYKVSDCLCKTRVHKDESTFSKKMGGSCYSCNWRCESGIGINLVNQAYHKISVDSQNNKEFQVIVKGDSASSYHYWRKEDHNCLSHIEPNATNNVTLPNEASIASS